MLRTLSPLALLLALSPARIAVPGQSTPTAETAQVRISRLAGDKTLSEATSTMAPRIDRTSVR